MDISEEEANQLITKTDRYRAEYYKFYTHGNYWTNPVNYDITLNSARISEEGCVQLILHCLKLKMGEEWFAQYMVLILVVVAVFGSEIPIIIFLIGILNWPAIAKLIYGNVLSLRGREFVEAERAIGSSDLKIIFKTILPNAIAPLWVALAFRISSAMITESALSFLGAGVQPPQASWGNIIQAATSLAVLTKRWWIWIPAGVCLVVTIVCINFVGEGIRDALDPKMKRL